MSAGCTSSDGPTATPPGSAGGDAGSTEVLADLTLASSLQPFDACEDLLGYVKEQALARVTAYGLSSGGMRFQAVGQAIEGDLPATDSGRTPATTTAPSSAPVDESSTTFESTSNSAGGDTGTEFSETNVQEAGVDEPDTVKTDARRILAIAENRLQYVDVTGDAPVVTGALDLPDAGSATFMVEGDRVLVISESGWSYPGGPISGGGFEDSRVYPSEPARPEVTLTLIDTSQPADMRILTSVRIDGTSVSARLVDGRARIVTTSSPTDLPFVYPAGPGGEETAEETNRQIITESTVDGWLPHVRTGTATAETDPGTLAVDCENVSRPKQFAGFDVLTVQTVDLGSDTIATSDATAIMANGQTVYASAQNLYVATPGYVESPDVQTSRSGSTGTTATVPAPGTVPTQTAPAAPAPDERAPTPEGEPAPDPEPTTTVVDPEQGGIEPWEPPEQTTSIHRFGIGEPGPAVYRASGQVPGTLLNQFSMSEHEDRLRVATTDSWSNSGPPESWVRVLEERDGALTEIGSVGGLGKNEQIKSVRFIGDRGYVVTFRQIDPLYTVDLSDPTAPRVTGELKILGYSAYLHPIGEDLLIGIGQDGTEAGQLTGTQVALFDVSDPANPRQIHQHLVGQGTSIAEQDHHAFLWWAPTNLAVIPAQNYDEGWFFNGAIGFTITPDGITELGRISHPYSFADGATSAGSESPNTTIAGPGGVACAPDGLCEPAPPFPCDFGGCPPYQQGGVAIDRSLVIGDRVYTVSATGVLASRIDDLGAIGGVDFER